MSIQPQVINAWRTSEPTPTALPSAISRRESTDRPKKTSRRSATRRATLPPSAAKVCRALARPSTPPVVRARTSHSVRVSPRPLRRVCVAPELCPVAGRYGGQGDLTDRVRHESLASPAHAARPAKKPGGSGARRSSAWWFAGRYWRGAFETARAAAEALVSGDASGSTKSRSYRRQRLPAAIRPGTLPERGAASFHKSGISQPCDHQNSNPARWHYSH